jgi:hypothetical protein
VYSEEIIIVRWPGDGSTTRRLHRDDGPAVETLGGVLDGYYVHGVGPCPAALWTCPGELTVEHIDAIKSEEVRRVTIERWPGAWPRYLHESGAELLDMRRNDRDSQSEQLYRLPSGRDPAGRRFVAVDPSTGRKYCLRVPWNIETCAQAQLWLSHGLDSRAVHRS